MPTQRITEVPMLQGDKNYLSWRAAVEARFRELGVYEHAIADQDFDQEVYKRFPSEPDYSTYKEDNRMDKYDQWKAQEAKAHRVIRNSISELMYETMTLKEGCGSASAWTIMSDLQKRYNELSHAETQYVVHQRWHTMNWDGDYIGFFISKWSAALTDCLDAGIEISEDTKFFTLMSAIDVQEKKVFKNWVRLTLAETQIKGHKTLGVYFRELIDTCTFESDIRMAQVEGDPKMITKRRCGVCGVTGHVSRGCWHLLPEIAPKELKFEPDKRLVQEFFKRKAEADKRNDKAKGKELGEEGDIEEIINKNSGEWEMVMGGMVWYKDYPKIAREETEWWQGVQGSE